MLSPSAATLGKPLTSHTRLANGGFRALWRGLLCRLAVGAGHWAEVDGSAVLPVSHTLSEVGGSRLWGMVLVDEPMVGLAEAIRSLRVELSKAMLTYHIAVGDL